jgi:hypothetical protein
VASKFTKKNPKLDRESMVAALLPYMITAMQQVDKATISFDYPWVNRAERARTDRCACLALPVGVTVGRWPDSHDILFSVRLLLRDDTQHLIDWNTEEQNVPKLAIRKAEVEFRRRLRHSKEPKVRDLAKLWARGGRLLAVDFRTGGFSELVRAVTTTE